MSAIRFGDSADATSNGRGFYIEDAGYPNFVSGFSPQPIAAGALGGKVAFRLLVKWLQRKPETDVGGAVSFFGDCA